MLVDGGTLYVGSYGSAVVVAHYTAAGSPTVYVGDRLFDDVFRGFGSDLPSFNGASFGDGWPSVEISDGEKEIKITAEVPGLEDKDIEVLLGDGVHPNFEGIKRVVTGILPTVQRALGPRR